MPKFILLVVTFGLLTGCFKTSPEYFGTIQPRHGPEEIWLNNSGEPEWIDPGKCSDSTGGEVIQNLFSGLTELHPATLEPMAAIAEGWDLSEDGRRHTFYLRESKWSDGTPLTAHDFEWSWKRVLDPATASKYSIIMYPLKHGAAFNQRALQLSGVPAEVSDQDITDWVADAIPVSKVERSADLVFVFANAPEEGAEPLDRAAAVEQLNGKTLQGRQVQVSVADDSVVGVHAEDERTLVVELEQPVPYFLSLTSYYPFMPVPRHVIERLESEGRNTDLWTRTENLVCNGAYKLVEWRFRQHMIFQRNDNYWNVGAPHIARLERVKALMVESYNTTLNLYCAGEIDFPGGQAMIPAEFEERMRPFKDYHASRYLGVYFYWFNTKAPPLDDPLVRKALTLAIDRKQITEYVTRGGQIPINSVVPDGLAGYKGLDTPLFDGEAARQALADAGYPGGQGFPPLTLIYNTTEIHKQIASAAQQMWKDNLGIQVQIENQEWKTYLSRLQRMDFQMARMGWIGDYADPNTFLELFSGNNGNNHSNWSDETYEEMLAEANATVDQAKRLDMLRKAERFVTRQYPVLPIYVYTRTQMIKPYLRGIWPNDQDRHLWKYLWIDESWYEGKPEKTAPDPQPPMIPLRKGN